MTEKKKKQPAEFAQDKNAFAGGGSAKGDTAAKRAKQKQPGAHQPRDADTTSGHDVQKSGQAKPFGQDADHSVKRNGQKVEGRPDSADVWENRSSFQSDTRKTTGEKAKSGQKKRRKQRQFQKENSFTGKKEKPDGGDADGKTESSFSKEQNAFMEEDGGEQAGDTKEFKDDYRRRDTYHQSEKKGRYHRREHQDRERTKKSDSGSGFQTKDNTFTESNSFTDGAEPEFQTGRSSRSAAASTASGFSAHKADEETDCRQRKRAGPKAREKERDKRLRQKPGTKDRDGMRLRKKSGNKTIE